MTSRGTLYIVATPIGNLEDITLRALRILKDVKLIAAEDTRHTRKLLNSYAITTPLTSLYDQNEREKSSFIIAKLNEGIDVAYVSDAGTPGISDPGYLLINAAIDNDIAVVPIPGPSAVVTALSASGLPMDSFSFWGFLPSRAGKRKQFLNSIKEETKTMVFYESPRRLMSTLKEIADILGNRPVVIARELTKLYEEILRGTVQELIESLDGRTIKGEVTLIISGATEISSTYSPEMVMKRFEELQSDTDISTRDMVDILSNESGIPRKEVYKKVLQFMEKTKRTK